MTSPSFVYLFKFVTTDVEVVKFGALESWPLGEFVVGDIEPFEVGESFFHFENGHRLDSVIREIQSRQSRQVLQCSDIGQSII